MLFKVKDLMQWKKPSSRNRQSYVNFISSERPPLSDEADFIKYKEDLGALGGELEDDGLNAFVETALYKSSKRGSQVDYFHLDTVLKIRLLTILSSSFSEVERKRIERTISMPHITTSASSICSSDRL